MASNIKLKRSAVAGRVPTTSDLDLGEVGLNTYDGQAYIKRQQGANEEIVSLNPVDRYGGNRVYVSAAKGNDNNDGIEFPVATIKKACILASGMAKPVTIYVATGDYVEDNPIIVNDNISIIGDNLRGVIIRPQNAKKDILRIRNKVLVEGVVFRDHLDNNGEADYTFRYALAFDDVDDVNVDRTVYSGLSSAKPIISTSPYIKDCSLISFIGGNGVLIDGSRINQFNTPIKQSEVELPVIGAAPVQGKSMVAAYFTILTFGGTAWHVINDAYCQLVSCFQLFGKHGVYAQSGGYASITNSASNFGIYALRGTGFRQNSYIFDNGYVSATSLIDGENAIEVIGTLRPVINHYVVKLYDTDYFTPSNVTYNPSTGSSTFTVNAHGYSNGDQIFIKTGSIVFTCDYDNNVSQTGYPRVTDPAANNWLYISNVTTNTFDVNVGASTDLSAHTFVSAATNAIKLRSEITGTYKTAGTTFTFDPTTDVNLIDDYIIISNHGLSNGDGIEYKSNTYQPIGGLIDRTKYFVQYVNENTIQLYEDESLSFKVDLTDVIGKSYTATNATYDPSTGLSVITIAGHGFEVGEKIKIATGSLVFTCSYDNHQTQVGYPRSTDPAADAWLSITAVTTNTFTVNVGSSTDLSTHIFVSADTNGITHQSDHSLEKDVEEFFVSNVDNHHNSYQNITIPAGSYTFTIGQTISGTNGSTNSNGTVFDWDPATRKLTVSVNQVQIGDSLLRNIFVLGMTISDHSASPQTVTIGICETRTDLYTTEFNVKSTIAGNELQNINQTVGKDISLHRPSIVNSSGHTWEFIGAGIDYNALPENGGQKVEAYEQYENLPGRVYSSGTDELGDFKVGKFIKAENRSGEITFSQRVVIGELSSLKLSISNVTIEEISLDAGLGDNEVGGASHTRLNTQKAARDFITNRLGDFVDKSVSINSVPNSIVQLNSAGKLNTDIIPPIRNFNTYKVIGQDGRTEIHLDIPFISVGAGDFVTEEVGGVDTSYVLQADNISQFLVIDNSHTSPTFTNTTTIEAVLSGAKGTVDTSLGTNGLEQGVLFGGAVTNVGSGYTPTNASQVYTNVSLTNVSSSGSGAKADITITNGTITNVDLRRGGTGYAANDTLSASSSDLGGSGSGFVFTVVNTIQRVFINLTGEKVKFSASSGAPDFIYDDNAPVKTINNAGSTSFTFNATTDVNYSSSRITLTSHGLSNGDFLEYDSTPNVAIGGLTNGSNYFVKVIDANTIELYTNYNLDTQYFASFSSSSTGTHSLSFNNVNVDLNKFYVSSHGLTTGDAIKAEGTTLPTGLVNTAFYFVGAVTTNTFTLHNTKAAAESSTGGLVVSAVSITGTGSGNTNLRVFNITIDGECNTSNISTTNWSVLSGASVDAANIVSGVISVDRLASSGSANNKTFLRGDSIWTEAVQGIVEDGDSPLTLVGDSFVDNTVNPNETVHYNRVKIGIQTVTGSSTGTSGYTRLGVSAYNHQQFDVSSIGDVTIKAASSGGTVDALTLNGNNDQYYLNPGNFVATVPVGKGGTNITTYAQGDLLYGNSSATISKLGIGNQSNVLAVSNGVPSWINFGIAIAKGIHTSNISATYNNGTAGIGATLTGSVNGVFPSADGVTFGNTDIVLINGQTNAEENGLYQITTVGSANSAFTATRVSDYDTVAEMSLGYVLVSNGLPTNTTLWRSNIETTGHTIGTDDIKYYKNILGRDTLYVDGDNNRVGIGVPAPTVALDVSGSIKVSGTSEFQNNISLPDSIGINFGSSNDLQIYHSGSSSNIRENGTGDLNIWGDNIVVYNSSGNEVKATFTTNGSVNLYYDNSKKFETTTSGVTVTGDIVTTGTEIADANSLQKSFTATTTSTSATLIASINGSTYRSVEFLIQVSENGNFHMEKVLVVHDGTTAYMTAYGTVHSGSVLATFDANIVSNVIRLLATASSTNTTTYKVVATAIKY